MKTKKLLTLEKEPYEKLQRLVKHLGWPKTWLAHEIDRLIAGLVQVAEQSIKDAEEAKEMTEAEARKRYEDMMRKILEKDQK